MTILYLSKEKAIIIDHQNKQYKYYEDGEEIPANDYFHIEIEIENLKDYAIDELVNLCKISGYREELL